MKRLSIVLLIVLTQAYGIAAQTSDDSKRREAEIREAVTTMMGPGDSVMGVRTDLRVFKGKLIRSDDKEFVIKPKKKSSGSGTESVRYSGVLEIEGKRVSLSYFPDPNQKPFSDWSSVRRLTHGDSLDIDLVGNESAFGVLLKTSETDLTLLDGNRNVVVGRDQIVRILLARRDTPGAKRILKGAAKGASAAKPGRGSTSTGAAIVDTVIMAGAALAGAASAAVKSWPNDRLLIYAK
ncbi:MAG: hypothetical protein ABI857_04315 [Acidobacteriota bacterium]